VIHRACPAARGYRGVIGRAERHHKFRATFQGAFRGCRWIKASSRCPVTGYNCDSANDPSENKLPFSIYGLLGLAAGRERGSLHARQHLFGKVALDAPRRRECRAIRAPLAK